MPLENIHTHTYRCGHASGDIEDYMTAAVSSGCTVIGFSDHTPLPPGWWPNIRMSIDQFRDYTAGVEQARRDALSVRVYLGLECEWQPGFGNFYDNEILAAAPMDYLIGAVHFFPYRGRWLYLERAEDPPRLAAYARQMADTIASGYFRFIAHPDAFLVGYGKWDSEAAACAEDILAAAAGADMVLEINGYGFRKRRQQGIPDARAYYPQEEFWRMAADRGIRCICNSDAHRPEDLLASLDECTDLAARCGLKVLSAKELLDDDFS